MIFDFRSTPPAIRHCLSCAFPASDRGSSCSVSSLAGLPPPLRLKMPPGWDAPSSLGVGQPTVELRGGVSRGEFFGTDTAGDARINRKDHGRKQRKRGLFTSGMPCRVGSRKSSKRAAPRLEATPDASGPSQLAKSTSPLCYRSEVDFSHSKIVKFQHLPAW